MRNFGPKKNSLLTICFAAIVFACFTLSIPVMSYGMNGQDCDETVMCGACGYLMKSDTPPLTFIALEVALFEENPPAKPLSIPKPQFHPPR